MTLLTIFACKSYSQTKTVCFKPPPNEGQDVDIWNFNGCSPDDWGGVPDNMNFGGTDQMSYSYWTYNLGGCEAGVSRSLIKFTDLASLPANIVITNATLNLYGVPPNPNSLGNATVGSGIYNDGKIYRVSSTTPWDQNLVTWNSFNSAPTLAGPFITIPPSASTWNWNTSINVTTMVKDIYDDLQLGVPDANQGFLMTLITEMAYRQTHFATSNNPDSTLWPELCITYHELSICDFSYCARSSHPGTIFFQADNTSFGNDYRWYLDGTYVSDHTGAYVNLTPGTHSLRLAIVDKDGKVLCENERIICIAPPATNPVPPAWCVPEFNICASTTDPDHYRLTAVQQGFSPEQYLWTTPSGYYHGSSVIIPAQQGTIGFLIMYYSPYFSKCYMELNLCAYFKPPNNSNSTDILSITSDGDFVVQIAPNPVKDYINVDYHFKTKGETEMLLYDAFGKNVWKKKFMRVAESGNLQIPVAELIDGVYLLKVQNGGQTKTVKILKMH